MSSNRLLGAALTQIGQQKGRSFMIITVLSVCMGCMLAMMAIGAGGEEQFEQSLTGTDPVRIIVTPGEGAASTLNDAAVASFLHIEGVQSATGVIVLPLTVMVGRYQAENLTVTAINPTALRGKFLLQTGALFDGQGNAPQLVLGYGAQMEFTAGNATSVTSVFDSGQNTAPTPPPVDWLALGAQVSLAAASEGTGEPAASPRTYQGRVCGILANDGGELDGMAYMSLLAAKKLIRENHEAAEALGLDATTYNTAYVHAVDIESVKAVKAAIASLGYHAESAVADLETLQVTLGLQRSLLTTIELFAALTALLLTVCILLASRMPRGTDPANKTIAQPITARLAGLTVLGVAGGVSAVMAACFFALIVNTSSVETVVFGMQFGQLSNLAIPVGSAMLTVGSSMLITFLGGLLVKCEPSALDFEVY